MNKVAVDKDLVRAASRLAWQARARSIGPRPNQFVGAVVVDSDGKLWDTSSVESQLYHFGECAERLAIYHALTHGASKITHLFVARSTKAGKSLHPCGACREVIQHLAPDAIICVLDKPNVVAVRGFRIADLLPSAFGQ